MPGDEGSELVEERVVEGGETQEAARSMKERAVLGMGIGPDDGPVQGEGPHDESG